MKATVYEIAVYQNQCVQSGRVCRNPERLYGDDWRDNFDIMVFKGTESELREYFEGTTGWLAKAGRAVLGEIALPAEWR